MDGSLIPGQEKLTGQPLQTQGLTSSPAGRRARFGPYEVDLVSRELRREGRSLRLQEKPFQVLTALLERPGDVVLREELRSRLWPGDTFVDFDNNLNTAVSKLREALGDVAGAPRYVETLPKRGYRLLAPVEWEAPPKTRGAAHGWRWAAAGLVALSLLAAALEYTPAERAGRVRRPPSGDAKAYEAYMQARYLAAKGDEESLRRALDFYRAAIRADGRYAAAYSGLSSALSALPGKPRDIMPESAEAARRAAELDDRLPEAHYRLAVIHLYYDWDWEGAGREFARAAELAPDWPELHQAYAGYFAMRGETDRALAQIRHAIALDPVSVAINADTSWYYYVARQNDGAIAQSLRTLDLEPTHRWAHIYLRLAYLAKGDRKSALAWSVRFARLCEAPAADLAAMQSGPPDRRWQAFWSWNESAMAELASERYVAPADRALLALGEGDRERALDLLDQSYDERSGWVMPFLHVYPQFDPLRGDPRFESLVARMRYPETSTRADLGPRSNPPQAQPPDVLE